MERVAMMNIKKILVGLAIGTLIIFTACSDDDSGPDNKYVNTWIYKNMEDYYLWNYDLPSSPSKAQAPDKFFDALLSDEDRFSWIQENYVELLNSLQGINKEAGYDFKLYRESSSNENVIAQVMYIKEGSLVETQGKDLKRGDVITHVNGERITISNYQDLLKEMSENHTIEYARPDGDNLVSKGTLSLNTAEFAENPNFMSKVIEAGDHKIGYYVYNFFATGPTSISTQYNDEMDNIFSEFKNEGVTDLVVDLRYNSGGAEGATINLASLIGANINNTVTFVRRQYNTGLQAALLDRFGGDYMIKKFIPKTENVGSLLNSARVYVLTSGRTASASELLINGLKPHMEVFVIGDTTVGKNVGSITIYEDDDPKNTWGMQPIVVKSFNSANQSEYSDGFAPDIVNLDNSLDLSPIGDEDEILLSLAIDHITGGSGSRKRVSARRQELESLGTSADFRRGSYNLVIDDERLKSFIKSSALE